MKRILMLLWVLWFFGNAVPMDREHAIANLPEWVENKSWGLIIAHVRDGLLEHQDMDFYGKMHLDNRNPKTNCTLFQELVAWICLDMRAGFGGYASVDGRNKRAAHFKSFLKLLITNEQVTHTQELVQDIVITLHPKSFPPQWNIAARTDGFSITTNEKRWFQQELVQDYQSVLTTKAYTVPSPKPVIPDSPFPFTCEGVTITEEDYKAYGNGTLTESRFNELHPTICNIVPKMADKTFKTYTQVKQYGYLFDTSYASLATDLRKAIEDYKNGVPTSTASSAPGSNSSFSSASSHTPKPWGSKPVTAPTAQGSSPAMTVAISKKVVGIAVACMAAGLASWYYVKSVFRAKYTKHVIINETGSEIIINDKYGNEITMSGDIGTVVNLPQRTGVITIKFRDAKTHRMRRLEIDLSQYEDDLNTFFINIIIRPTGRFESYFDKLPLSYSVRWAPCNDTE